MIHALLLLSIFGWWRAQRTARWYRMIATGEVLTCTRTPFHDGPCNGYAGYLCRGFWK